MKWQKIEEVVSSYTYTQMYPTSKNQRHSADQVDIFYSAQNTSTIYQSQKFPPENWPVYVEYSIMIYNMAYATEAELEGLFENFQKTSILTALS